jgi:hypothetical protein
LKNRNFVVAIKDGIFKFGFSGTQRYCVIPGQLSVLWFILTIAIAVGESISRHESMLLDNVCIRQAR